MRPSSFESLTLGLKMRVERPFTISYGKVPKMYFNVLFFENFYLFFKKMKNKRTYFSYAFWISSQCLHHQNHTTSQFDMRVHRSFCDKHRLSNTRNSKGNKIFSRSFWRNFLRATAFRKSATKKILQEVGSQTFFWWLRTS